MNQTDVDRYAMDLAENRHRRRSPPWVLLAYLGGLAVWAGVVAWIF